MKVVRISTTWTERNTESAHDRLRLGVGAQLAGAMVLVLCGECPLLGDVTGAIGASSRLCGAIGLVGTQLGVVPLDAVLAWLLVVTFNLSLTTGPACSAYRREICEHVYASDRARHGIPYRTLRWEWMIRLASSGVKSSMLGLSCWSDMTVTGAFGKNEGEQCLWEDVATGFSGDKVEVYIVCQTERRRKGEERTRRNFGEASSCRVGRGLVSVLPGSNRGTDKSNKKSMDSNKRKYAYANRQICAQVRL